MQISGFTSVDYLLLTFISINTVPPLSVYASTAITRLVPDENFSGSGSGYHLQALDPRGDDWKYVVTDFWMGELEEEDEPEVTSCAVCHVICREHGDYNTGSTYTIPEDGGGMVILHADCVGDEASLSSCYVTDHLPGQSRYHVGVQCFRIPSLSEYYSKWFILGTVLLGVLMVGVGVCTVWIWWCRKKGEKKGVSDGAAAAAGGNIQQTHQNRAFVTTGVADVLSTGESGARRETGAEGESCARGETGTTLHQVDETQASKGTCTGDVNAQDGTRL